jgi:hypothetical protein
LRNFHFNVGRRCKEQRNGKLALIFGENSFEASYGGIFSRENLISFGTFV